MATRQGQLLRDVLPAYGIATLTELAQRLQLPKQHTWLLWHGKIGLSAAMLRRVHEACGVPLEALLQVERAVPAQRQGRKPLRAQVNSRPLTTGEDTP